MVNLGNLSGEILGIFGTIAVSIVTTYIVIRERILKNEMKNEQLKEYIDNNIKLIDNKIIQIQEDLIDFKELNRETSKSLQETASAIRELKAVLEILKDDLDETRAIRRSYQSFRPSKSEE